MTWVMDTGVKVENPIFQGISMTEASHLFGLPVVDVRAKLAGILPIGQRRNANVYPVGLVARAIYGKSVVGEEDDEETFRRIMRLKADELPPRLRENFWKTERIRQSYEKEKGDLWPTSQIIELAGEALKTLRLSLLLLPDTLAREANLSEKQRAVVTRLIDGSLMEAQRKLVDAFTEQRGNPVGQPQDAQQAADDDDETI